jgi:hypothetical protein
VSAEGWRCCATCSNLRRPGPRRRAASCWHLGLYLFPMSPWRSDYGHAGSRCTNWLPRLVTPRPELVGYAVRVGADVLAKR